MSSPGDVGGTVGVEEEFHLLNPSDGTLAAGVAEVLAAAQPDEFDPELLRSTVETATAVCGSMDEVREQVLDGRRRLLATAGRANLLLAASGTVPDAGTRFPGVFPTTRYEGMLAEYQQLAREQAICAFQVQVGVPDRDLAVRLLPRVQVWLPVLLALSASSPFYRGRDTGYASYRTQIWSRWPTAGPVPQFDGAAEYDAAVAALVDTRTISDPRMVYFDARPSARYPTLEIRIADACPRADDVVLLAGLGRALVTAAARDEAAGVPAPSVRQELLRAASWRAARSGLSGVLVDPVAAAAVPAGELVDRLLRFVGPALDDTGERATVTELLAAHRGRPLSAERQRAAYARAGRLRDVVDQIVAETAAGT